MDVVCGCIRDVVILEEGYRIMLSLNLLCVEEGWWREGDRRGLSLMVCPLKA